MTPVNSSEYFSGGGQQWQTPTYTAPAGANGTFPFQAIILTDNIVRFKGTVSATGAIAANATLFTLPPSMWPAKAVNCFTDYNNTSVVMQVNTNGTVALPFTAMANTDFVSFNNISYPLG
jgi:hypothetical protein